MARKPKADKKAAEGDSPEGEPKKKKGLVLPAVIVMVGLLGAGYLMSGKSSKAAPATASAATTSTTVATSLPIGPILSIDPTTINLADGHFLEVGMALQIDTAADLTPVTNDEALALSAAINLLSKQTMAGLGTPDGKDAADKALVAALKKIFGAKVTGVYFTDFVMQ